MTIFFISDLHLNENRLHSYRLFVNFFNSLPTDTTAIYILGDLFEFWVDDQLDSIFLTNVKNILKNATNKVAIYFIHGNRDFLIGQNFIKQTNINVLPEFSKIKIFEHNILLTHGDALVADKRHYYFSKIIRHPITKFIANVLPIKIKIAVAKKLRNISKNRFKANKNVKHYDVCPLIVQKVLQTHNAQILIHGHTHKPNVYNFNDYTRIILGSWDDDNPQILMFNQHGYKLSTLC